MNGVQAVIYRIIRPAGLPAVQCAPGGGRSIGGTSNE
ncbi:MAG: hypothetical protein RIR77_420 [Planctomycetota bacterium]|jgi:hypothetical protein